VTDGVDALVADPEDTAALGEAIVRLLREPGLGDRLTEAGHRRVERYGWDRVAACYESVYDGCP
jgi:glycosyltransferase involved in cell wall biosynthesis